MAKSKYHPLVEKMINSVKCSNPTIPVEAVAIMVNYKLISMISNMRVKIDYSKSMGLAPINFYGILLADSGLGKTSSLSTLNNWYFNEVQDALKGLYNNRKSKYLEAKSFELDEEDFKKEAASLSNWTFKVSSGTKEGVFKLINTLDKIKALTMSIEIDEFDKYMSSEAEIINGLFQAYDVGSWSPKLTAGNELQNSIYGVAPNFFGFATPDAMLLNSNVSEPFRELLASGFARRTLFYYEDTDKLPYIPTAKELEDMDELSEELFEEAESSREYLLSLLNRDNLEKVIGFEKKAKQMIMEYRSNSIEASTQTQDKIMNAELRERHFKVAKIAGAYAFLDGKDKIDIQSLNYAISLVEDSTKSLERIGNSKSMIERLYLRVRSEEGFVHTQDMLSFGLVPKNNTTKIKEYAEELEAYADVYGDIYEEMRDSKNSISAVRITQLITTDENHCIFSASMPRSNGEYNHDSGYKKAEIEFNSIQQWVSSDKKICYSPVAFKNGKRNNESTEAYSNVIVMDIDEGMSIAYAKEIFKKYYAIIATTRNHQKEKNGVVCDRFRVILLADKYIYTDPKKYTGLMKNIQKFYDFTMDEACFDKAHIYYSNDGELWMGECEKKLEVSKLIPCDEDHLSKKIERKVQSFKPEGGKALRLYFENIVKNACREGTGIINALSSAMLAITDKMQDQFKTLDEAEEWISELADCADDSYWERHSLESEVLNTLRKRWED